LFFDETVVATIRRVIDDDYPRCYSYCMHKKVFVLSKDIEVGLSKGELMAANSRTGMVYFYEPVSQWVFDAFEKPTDAQSLIAKYESLGGEGAGAYLRDFIDDLAAEGILEVSEATPSAPPEITSLAQPVFIRQSNYTLNETALMSIVPMALPL